MNLFRAVPSSADWLLPRRLRLLAAMPSLV